MNYPSPRYLLVTRTEQGFNLSVYRKPTFTGLYLSSNSHHSYNVKKGIISCLKLWAKAISNDTDATEEIISLRYNFHRNSYPKRITSALRKMDRMIEGDIWKLIIICLPYVKAKRIQKICTPFVIRIIFQSGLTLRGYLFCVKLSSHQKNPKWPNTCVLHPLQLYTKARHATH